MLVIAFGACGEGSPRADATAPTIAFLFDGRPPDADLVSGPALAGLELAAREVGSVEIEPVDVGADPGEVWEALRALGDDRRVLAAVVAPWTAPPPGAIAQLATDGLPVVSLSWAWGPPTSGPWRSFVVGRAEEAIALLEAAGAVVNDASVCLAGDDHPTSRALLATAEELGVAVGDPELVVSGVARVGSTATAERVAARIAHADCPVLAWVGGAPTASAVLEAISEPPAIVGTSRLKTDEGLTLVGPGGEVLPECSCPDVTLSLDPATMRFVHDVQADSGAPPGPFAVEAYDAGNLVLDAPDGTFTRASVAARISEITTFVGLVGTYVFEPDGSRITPPAAEPGRWRAVGSRWLPA